VKASSSGGPRGWWRHRDGAGSLLDEVVQHFLDAKVGQRRAEKHRGQTAGAILGEIEGMAGATHQFDFIPQGLRPRRAQRRVHVRMVEALEDAPVLMRPSREGS